MRKFLSFFILGLSLAAPLHAFGSGGCDINAGLLIHSDTAFTDEDCDGNLPKTITNNGSLTVNTTNFKFGGGSMGFDGTTKYLAIGNDSTFNWAGAFTVDCQVRTVDKTSDTQFRTIWARGSTVTSGNIQVSMDTSGHVVVIDSAGGGTVEITGTTDISTGAWFWVALKRDASNNMILLVNGIQEGGTFVTAENYNANQQFEVGIYAGTNLTGRWNGQIDEFRVSPGIDRYPLLPANSPTTPYCSGCEMMGVLR